MQSLFDHTLSSLAEHLVSLGLPKFRAKQILEWVYKHKAESYEQMSNLPKALRKTLAESLPVFRSRIAHRTNASDGTTKLLLAWPDGATSECVLIPSDERQTACISTQVGCPVGCAFCASGLGGFERQLTAGEIIEQAMRVQQLVTSDDRLSNVVFMGLGEPLANYDATIAAVRTINAEWGMGIGARKITVSTVGLPDQIRRLANEQLQITLALSLHAPSDELRAEIIPWAQKVGIAELVQAGRYYFEKTGREVTLEYILLGGLNDQPAHARQLAHICRKLRSNVNLIRYNPVPGLPYSRPADDDVKIFQEALRGMATNTHLRSSRGLDIDAACGQLRRRKEGDTV